MVMIESMSPGMTLGQFCPEAWVWNKDDMSPSVWLSKDHEAAYFHIDPVCGSQGTAGVRGTKGFTGGEHYWEITFPEPPRGTSVMFGVGTQEAGLHTDNFNFVNLVGIDSQSWGLSHRGCVWHDGVSRPYCEAFYDESTVIGVHLNLYVGTLTFYKNGKNLGTAFSGLQNLKTKLYPFISSTAADTELQVGSRMCRYASLQEKCTYTIVNSLKDKKDATSLPLPMLMKNHIASLM